MRKSLILTALILAGALLALPAAVTTVPDKASPTGYTTTFTYTDSEATNARLVGSFTFYKDNDLRVFANGAILNKTDKVANYVSGPESWSPDGSMRHINDEGYTVEMAKDGDTFTYAMQLPCASYLYFFQVSYDNGESWARVTDPDNLPPQNSYSMNAQYRSQFFVPYDASKQAASDDWTFLLPVEDPSKAGTIEYLEYTGADGSARPAQVYLPAGYDAEREEPYKAVFMSHGGGGAEGDWFHQGNVNNIADRLIADGVIEPFIIVAPENVTFTIKSGTDYHAIYDDMVNYLFPALEEKYNITTDPEDRAMVGLSRGANVTSWILLRETATFGSYALLSCGGVNLYSADSYNEYLGSVDIYLGGGFSDQAFLRANTLDLNKVSSVMGFAWLMNNLGLEFNHGDPVKVVPGAHDWFIWPQLALDYFSNYLWK